MYFTLNHVNWATLLLSAVLMISAQAAENGNSTEAVGPVDGEGPRLDPKYFLAQLLHQYGDGDLISKAQIQNMLDTIQKRGHVDEQDTSAALNGITEDTESGLQGNGSCDQDDAWLTNKECLHTKCLSAEDVFVIHELRSDRANGSELAEMSPTLLYVAQSSNCSPAGDEIPAHVPDTAQVWGYSFLCVTVINLCSLMGMVFLPLMQKPFYKRLLMFMVALAVGTLSGSALLFLLPECFEMVGSQHHVFDGYVWKCTTILGGIYMFFLVERILKNVMDWRKKTVKFDSDFSSVDPTTLTTASNYYEPLKKGANASDNNLENAPLSSVKTRAIHRNESMNMSFSVPEQCKNSDPCLVIEEVASEDTPSTPLNTEPPAAPDGLNSTLTPNDSTASFGYLRANVSSAQLLGKAPEYSSESSSPPSSSPSDTEIKSVAWMVIFGDGLHNFIDGLSIGAAFSKNIMAGVSVSLAVVCEELPHELGDFAILLNSGMSMKQALTYNFLSACMCYLGLAIGILVGEMTSGSTWIFALAAGMFLYISLVDMLPEVNHAAEQEAKTTGHTWRIFLIQNAGLLMGYGIMVILAVYSDEIQLD